MPSSPTPWHVGGTFPSDCRGNFWRGLGKAALRPRHGTRQTQRRGCGRHSSHNKHVIISVIPHGELSREAPKAN